MLGMTLLGLFRMIERGEGSITPNIHSFFMDGS